jgi:hypothetical protein
MRAKYCLQIQPEPQNAQSRIRILKLLPKKSKHFDLSDHIKRRLLCIDPGNTLAIYF